MNYTDLEIWQLARKATTDIHKMTISKLPKFEMYETGSQIRRSVKSIRSNIVEGFGRRRYKQEYLRFLVFAHASCDETIDHLLTLKDCESLTDDDLFTRLNSLLDELGRKLNRFIQSVEEQHQSPK
ncbi:MAG: four helix bundle protein [Pedosphaera sp.]|nr:four helix bundle protein [Pedosphaera sp.]